MSGRTRLAAMATAGALACLPTAAQEFRVFYSGNDLWAACSGKSAVQSGLCMGYVTGIADAMGTSTGILRRRACLPEHTTAVQTQDVVKRYLEQHPETRHYAAAGLAAAALAEAFPCKQ